MSFLNLSDILRDVLCEVVAPSDVNSAINSREGVVVTYHDGTKTAHTKSRYIEPYVYIRTSAGNDAVWCYQYYGDTKRGVPNWKLLRLDRVTSWEPSGQHFDAEPRDRGWNAASFDNDGQGLKSQVLNIVRFDKEEKPMTDLEKLRAKTRQLQNSRPLNIKDFNKSGNEADKTPQQKPVTPQNGPETYGPKGDVKPQQDRFKNSTIPEPNGGNGNTNDVNPSGPVVTSNPTPAQNAARRFKMTDAQFQTMLRRNLELTAREKAQRQAIQQRNNKDTETTDRDGKRYQRDTEAGQEA